MAALRLAYSAFWNAQNSTHRIATPATVVCLASTAKAAAPSRAMLRVQRCRLPRSQPNASPCVVRSDSAPASGVARPDEMAPTADTMLRATILCRGVMSCSWIGISTCSGVSEAIHIPRLARRRPHAGPAGPRLAWLTMRLTVIGCAGSFPGPDSPASCYLVEAEGFRLLLDLGNGALGALQRHAGLFEIDAICLSHLHGDHCLDMASYWVARTYSPDGPKPRIPVYGPAGTADRLAGAQGSSLAREMPPAFSFETLTPGTRRIGPFEITADHVNHPVETFAFRLEHGGRALAYSADTGESAALVRLARGADLLLCEASFAEVPADAGAAPNPPDLHLTG